jgi:6,7-dimethyl-8-ribityllumazine synthase
MQEMSDSMIPPPPPPLAKAPPLRPRMAPRSNFAFAIVASQYNIEFTQALVDNACREIALLEQGAKTQIYWAPGAYEIPVLAKILTEQGRNDAILCFAAILQGETAHAQLIAQAVTSALQHVAIGYGVPVLDGVLLFDSPEQARARCIDPSKNRGVEAARAAVGVARMVREIHAR